MSSAVLLVSSTVTNEVDKVPSASLAPVRLLPPLPSSRLLPAAGHARHSGRLSEFRPCVCVCVCARARARARVQVRQRKLVAAMESKKVRFTEVDGSDPEQKDVRGQLFELSGLRGKYPQVFLKDEGGQYSFVGDWDEFEGLLDSDALPPEVLKENPGIKTFTAVFACCIAAAE